MKERLKVQPDGRPRLIVCDTCPEKEVPLKDRDHAMHPIRYMVIKLDTARGGGLAIPGCLPAR